MTPRSFLLIAVIFIQSLFFSSHLKAQMYYNQACRFTGVPGSYVAVPNSATINITGSFTAEFWMSPQSVAGTQTIISKGNTPNALKYGVQLIGNRIAVLTDNVVRLQSSQIIPPFTWTHVAATYNSGTHQFRLFINGAQDTLRTDIGAQPDATGDSLFIGGLPATQPFFGRLDEVRIWNRALTPAEAGMYFRTSLCVNTGIYSGLVMSMAFQGPNATQGFEFEDQTSGNNNGFGRNVFAVDQYGSPQNTISYNESVEFDGTDDYIALADAINLSPTSQINLEVWVYPRNNNAAHLISKGTDYRIFTAGGNVSFMINNTVLNTGVALPVNQWSLISFAYVASTGKYEFYFNGELRTENIAALGPVANGTDSLFIGGGPSLNDFNGYIDDFRIINLRKNITNVNEQIFKSVDGINSIHPSLNINFDGGNGLLNFRNNARFSHPGCIALQPVSPMVRSDENNFYDGFFVKQERARIPATGSAGSVTLTKQINQKLAISDVNLFVAINHTKSANLELVLVGPNGDSCKVFSNNFTNSWENNVVTIFDDNADSTMINARFASFGSTVKPVNNLNTVFSGDNTSGEWKLIVRDGAAGDTGMVYGWGMQFNNENDRPKELSLSLLLQGFYNPSTDLMVQDTVTIKMRGPVAPFAIFKTDKAVVNSNGKIALSFNCCINNNQQYIVEIIHRNSISVYSKRFMFPYYEASYSFIGDDTTAIGNNQIQVDDTPLKFALYGGDADQSGNVNLADITEVFNAASSFTSGYVDQDMTGDNVVNLADVALTFNNSAKFVQVVNP